MIKANVDVAKCRKMSQNVAKCRKMSLNVAKCHSNYVLSCKWEKNRKTFIQLLISVLILLVTKIMITWQTFRDMRDVLLYGGNK